MNTIITILALSMSVAALSTPVRSLHDSSPDIRVLISQSGSTRIKATMTNHGEKGYNILSSGSFLDDRPVDKAIVTIDGAKVPSVGIEVLHTKANIDPALFIALDAGQTHEVEFDLTETYPLHESSHGLHNIVSQGRLHYADFNSTQLLGQFPFSSNQISVDIDLREAAAKFETYNKRSDLSERAVIDRAHCSSTQGAEITAALRSCSRQASAAAIAARSGTGRLYEKWFTDRSRAGAVANGFNWVASECANNGDNRFTIYCRDPGTGNPCATEGTLAFVRRAQNEMVLCGLFFQDPETTTDCRNIGFSRAGTLIHEFMHLQPTNGCADISGTPGGSQGLDASRKWLNCESYTLFAGELAANC